MQQVRLREGNMAKLTIKLLQSTIHTLEQRLEQANTLARKQEFNIACLRETANRSLAVDDSLMAMSDACKACASMAEVINTITMRVMVKL